MCLCVELLLIGYRHNYFVDYPFTGLPPFALFVVKKVDYGRR
jgi:hypothetical protein